MKIEYEPSVEKTYTTTERFSVFCEESKIGMWVFGDSLRFVGWNNSTLQVDELGFRRDKLTPELLVKFVDAYNRRNEK